jgi:predicted nucleic acid-binding protein
LVKENDEPQELTFLQAEEIYRANKGEKSIPLTNHHHMQVEKAISLFKQQLEIEKQAERTVVITQSPQEKQALAYLDAIINLPLADDNEKLLLSQAKEAINLGKFQKLTKEVATLAKSLKKGSMIPTVQLETLLKIAKKYPLQSDEAENNEKTNTKNAQNFAPEIIISESFQLKKS